MKKIIILMIMLLTFSLVHAAVPYSTPQVEVTLQSQNPDPVEPGQVLTVKFKVENEGIETSDDVIVKILPKFPFTLYGDVAEKNIGKLRASSTGADAEIIEYKLKVDEQAVEGNNELELKVQIGDGYISYTNNEFLINIQTHDTVLDITSITTDPERIAPGETAEITIMTKNLADSLMKDIKFKLDFSSATLPLAPYQSSSERRISQLNSNYQNSMKFKIIADPDAASGLYKIPLNVSYNDELGNSYSMSDILAVTIGETPKAKVYVKRSTVLQADKEGKVTLEIANHGATGIKFLEIYVLDSDDYQLISTSNYFYIGDVDSDDTESEEIDIYVNKEVDKLRIPLMLKYSDANGKSYQQEFDLETNLYSASELKKFGVIKSSNVWIYLIIAILAVGGYFFYKRYHKKKKKQ